MIRVMLPYHLRNLARTGPEVTVDVKGTVTTGAVLDAVEAAYPMLKGTIRDHMTKARRPFLRYFVCGEDLSLADANEPLPDDIASGREPFCVIGAIAGG